VAVAAVGPGAGALAPPSASVGLRARLAWTLAGMSLVLAVAGIALAAWWSVPLDALAAIHALTVPVVGGLVVSRRPRNAVGWVLIAIGAAQAIATIALPYAVVGLDLRPRGLPAASFIAWLSDWAWIPGHALAVAFLPLLVPDGHLPSRRWWPALALSATALAFHLAAPMTVLGQLHLRTSASDLYPDERLAGLLGTIGYWGIQAASVVAVVAMGWRLRRMRTDERGPYLWFAGAVALTVVLVLPVNFVPGSAGKEVLRVGAAAALPVGAAVAILRQRAYGIDVVVNRTLVYGSLSAILTAGYLALAAATEVLLGGRSVLAAVLAAAVTAAGLSPLRERLQIGVNRLLYGHRDAPGAVVSRMGDRLAALTAGPEALGDVTDAVAGALRLPYVAITTDDETGDGRVLASTGARPQVVEEVPLIAHGEVVGAFEVAPRRGSVALSVPDHRALHELGRVAANAVRQVQLGEDLRSARARLVTALEHERRRIRRDLHDGLGPSLASVVMGLEEVRAIHRGAPDRAESLLLDLKSQTRTAVEDIRELVYGLRPPALDELGLLAALRELADGTTMRTGLTVTLEAPPHLGDLGAAVDVTLYRIVQEALTNVVRHAEAESCHVRLQVQGGDLHLEVRDDGVGLPSPVRPGVGLRSMRERAADVGGRVDWAADGGGTVVRVSVPAPMPMPA
jgi:signal transduction histidine kinase